MSKPGSYGGPHHLFKKNITVSIQVSQPKNPEKNEGGKKIAFFISH
jgi:hypothetical protein